jgi:hypothetical protein
MATLAQKIEADHRMRELLDENDLPPPDAVEYGYTCIRLFWKESRTVVIVDIDEPLPGSQLAGEEDRTGHNRRMLAKDSEGSRGCESTLRIVQPPNGRS